MSELPTFLIILSSESLVSYFRDFFWGWRVDGGWGVDMIFREDFVKDAVFGWGRKDGCGQDFGVYFYEEGAF